MTSWTPGDRVWWAHTPRGGYGYTRSVPCIVERVTARRVTIRARLAAGGTKLVSVQAANLRPRNEPDPVDDALAAECTHDQTPRKGTT